MAKRPDKDLEPTTGADLLADPKYGELLDDIKQRLAAARTRAAAAVNTELLQMYWEIGREILKRQEAEGWGTKVVDQLARDLKDDGAKGFSVRNLKYMRALAEAWPAESSEEFVQQPVAQIPWGHNTVLLNKLDDAEARRWYAERALAGGWSRAVLEHQIGTGLRERQGKAITNFSETLPAPQSELAQEIFKSEYNLEFIAGSDVARERDLELALLADIEKFLMELGTGFMFAGRQVRLDVDGDEFFIDLLFYQHHLRRFVVIELKVGSFEPEFAGKLNFYLNAVDAQMRREDDRESIGILLCTDRNRQVVEYALRGLETPLGVSTYQLGEGDDNLELTEELPAELKPELPSVPQLTAGLQRIVSERAKEIEAALEGNGSEETEPADE